MDNMEKLVYVSPAEISDDLKQVIHYQFSSGLKENIEMSVMITAALIVSAASAGYDDVIPYGEWKDETGSYLRAMESQETA